MSGVGKFKGVFWDFGGVITSSPFERFNQLEKRLNLPHNFIRQVNSIEPHTNAWAQLERGEISRERFENEFRRESAALGHEVSGAEVLTVLAGKLRPEMVQALQRIRGRMVQGCLTNNLLPADRDDWTRQMDAEVAEAMGLFDFVQESSAEGLRKPEPEFYRMAMRKSGLEDPAQVIFLDDLGINLKPARAMGMHTIKVVDPGRALADLQQLIGFSLD